MGCGASCTNGVHAPTPPVKSGLRLSPLRHLPSLRTGAADGSLLAAPLAGSSSSPRLLPPLAMLLSAAAAGDGPCSTADPATVARAERMRTLNMSTLPPPLHPPRPVLQGVEERLAKLLTEVAAPATAKGAAPDVELRKGSAAQQARLVLQFEVRKEEHEVEAIPWVPPRATPLLVVAARGLWAAHTAAGLPPPPVVFPEPRSLLRAITTFSRPGGAAFLATARGKGLLEHLTWPRGASLEDFAPPRTVTLLLQSRTEGTRPVPVVLPLVSAEAGTASLRGTSGFEPMVPLQEYVDSFASRGWAQIRVDGLPANLSSALQPLLELMCGGAVTPDQLGQWLGISSAELLSCSSPFGTSHVTAHLSRLLGPLKNAVSTARMYGGFDAAGVAELLQMLRNRNKPAAAASASEASVEAGPAPPTTVSGAGERVALLSSMFERVLTARLMLTCLPPGRVTVVRTESAGSVEALGEFLAGLSPGAAAPGWPHVACTVMPGEPGTGDVVLVAQVLRIAHTDTLNWRKEYSYHSVRPGPTLIFMGPSKTRCSTGPDLGAGAPPLAADRSPLPALDKDVLRCVLETAEAAATHGPAEEAAALFALNALMASAHGAADAAQHPLRGSLAGDLWGLVTSSMPLLGRLLRLATRGGGRPPQHAGAPQIGTSASALGQRAPLPAWLPSAAACRERLMATLEPHLTALLKNAEPSSTCTLVMECVRYNASAALRRLLVCGALGSLCAARGGRGYRAVVGATNDALVPEAKLEPDPNKAVHDYWPEETMPYGEAAVAAVLSLAVVTQAHDCLLALLRHGADTNSRDVSFWHLGSVSAAAHSGGLLPAAADQGPATRDRWEPPALGVVPWWHFSKPLLKCGGVTPLHLAADLGDELSAALLLHAGARGDARAVFYTAAAEQATQLGPGPTPAEVALLRGIPGLAAACSQAVTGPAIEGGPLVLQLAVGTVLPLRVLRLPGVGLEASGMAELCRGLKASPMLPALELLDLHGNPLTTTRGASDGSGLTALAELLPSAKLLRQLLLDGPCWAQQRGSASAGTLLPPKADALLEVLLGPTCSVTQLDALLLTRRREQGSAANHGGGGAPVSGLGCTHFPRLPNSEPWVLVRPGRRQLSGDADDAGTSAEEGSAADADDGASDALNDPIRLPWAGSVSLACCAGGEAGLVSSWRSSDWHVASREVHGPLGTRLATTWLASATTAAIAVLLEPSLGQGMASAAGAWEGDELATLLGGSQNLQHLTLLFLPALPSTSATGQASGLMQPAPAPLGSRRDLETGAPPKGADALQCARFMSTLTSVLRRSHAQSGLVSLGLLVVGPLDPQHEQALRSAADELWAALQRLTWLERVNGVALRGMASTLGPSPLTAWLPVRAFFTALRVEMEDEEVGEPGGGGEDGLADQQAPEPHVSSRQALERRKTLKRRKEDWPAVLVFLSASDTEELRSAQECYLTGGSYEGGVVNLTRLAAAAWAPQLGEGAFASGPPWDADLPAALVNGARLQWRPAEKTWVLLIETDDGLGIISNARQLGFLLREHAVRADAGVRESLSTHGAGKRLAVEVSICPQLWVKSVNYRRTQILLQCPLLALEEALLLCAPQLEALELRLAPEVPPEAIPALHDLMAALRDHHPSLRTVNGLQRAKQSAAAGVQEAVHSAGDGEGRLDPVTLAARLVWQLPSHAAHMRNIGLTARPPVCIWPVLQVPLPALQQLSLTELAAGQEELVLIAAQLLPSLPSLELLEVRMALKPFRGWGSRRRKQHSDNSPADVRVPWLLRVGLTALGSAAAAHPKLQEVNGLALAAFRGACVAHSSGDGGAEQEVCEDWRDVQSAGIRLALLQLASPAMLDFVQRLQLSCPSAPSARAWPLLQGSGAAAAGEALSASFASVGVGGHAGVSCLRLRAGMAPPLLVASQGWFAAATRGLAARCGASRLQSLELGLIPIAELADLATEVARLLPHLPLLRVMELGLAPEPEPEEDAEESDDDDQSRPPEAPTQLTSVRAAAAFMAAVELLMGAALAHPKLERVNGLALRLVAPQVELWQPGADKLADSLQIALLLQRVATPPAAGRPGQVLPEGCTVTYRFSPPSTAAEGGCMLAWAHSLELVRVLALAKMVQLPPQVSTFLQSGLVRVLFSKGGSLIWRSGGALELNWLDHAKIEMDMRQDNCGAKLEGCIQVLEWLSLKELGLWDAITEVRVGLLQGLAGHQLLPWGYSQRYLNPCVRSWWQAGQTVQMCPHSSSAPLLTAYLETLVLRRVGCHRQVAQLGPLTAALEALSSMVGPYVAGGHEGLLARLRTAIQPIVSELSSSADPAGTDARLHGLPMHLLLSGGQVGGISFTSDGSKSQVSLMTHREEAFEVADVQVAAAVLAALMPPAAWTSVALTGAHAPVCFTLRHLAALSMDPSAGPPPSAGAAQGAMQQRQTLPPLQRAPPQPSPLCLTALVIDQPLPLYGPGSEAVDLLLCVLRQHAWPSMALQRLTVRLVTQTTAVRQADDASEAALAAKDSFFNHWKPARQPALVILQEEELQRLTELALALMRLPGLKQLSYEVDGAPSLFGTGITHPLLTEPVRAAAQRIFGKGAPPQKVAMQWTGVKAVAPPAQPRSFHLGQRGHKFGLEGLTTPVSPLVALAAMGSCPVEVCVEASSGGTVDVQLLMWRIKALIASQPASQPLPQALELRVPLGYPATLEAVAEVLAAMRAKAAQRRGGGGNSMGEARRHPPLRSLALNLQEDASKGKTPDSLKFVRLAALRRVLLEALPGFPELAAGGGLEVSTTEVYEELLPGGPASFSEEAAFATRLMDAISAAARRTETFHGLPVALLSSGRMAAVEVEGTRVRIVTEGRESTECESTTVAPLLVSILLKTSPAMILQAPAGLPVPLRWLLWRLTALQAAAAPALPAGGGLRELRLGSEAVVRSIIDAEALVKLLGAAPSLQALGVVINFQLVVQTRDEDEKQPVMRALALALLTHPGLKELSLTQTAEKEQGSPSPLSLDEMAGLPFLSEKLEVPAEVLRRPLDEVIGYMRQLRGGATYSYRCKLMLVGPGGAGKTTLVHRLLKSQFDPDIGATDGLGVHEWAVPLSPEDAKGAQDLEMTFSLWDFGGQDVYYSTHAFFMARRAVYLVLWRSRDDQELGAVREYLDRIKALAPGATMILVGTHAGEKTDGKGGVYHPAQPPESLFREHPQLLPEAVFVSSKTGYGMDRLREVVLRAALAQPNMGEKLPTTLVKLREELRLARDALRPPKEPLMPLPDYEALAQRLGIEEKQELETATSLLGDFGDISLFASVPGLDRVVVLRPQWVADVMSSVITMDGAKLSKLLISGGGPGGGGGGAGEASGGAAAVVRVSRAALLELMAELSPSHAAGLVALMERFSLLHAIDDRAVLVPPLLPRASALDKVHVLHTEASRHPDGPQCRWWHSAYAYSYLPDALLCRALCRLFALPNVEVVEAWRFGAVVRRNRHLACIGQGDASSAAGRNAVQVTVCGPRPEVLGCLVSAKLRELLAEAFAGVKLKDVSFGCPVCVAKHGAHPGSYSVSQNLRKRPPTLQAKQAWLIPCPTCDAECDVESLALRDDQAQRLLPGQGAGGGGGGGGAKGVDGAMLLRVLQAAEGMAAQVQGVQSAIMGRLDGMQGALTSAQSEAAAEVQRRVVALHRTVAELDARPLPTLHVILPMPSEERAWWDVAGLAKARFRLHLLCEHPGGPHLTDHGGYEIEKPREWLRRHAPGLRVLCHSAGLLLGAAVRAATSGGTDAGLGRLGAVVDQFVLNEPLQAFGKVNDLLAKLEAEGAPAKGAGGAAAAGGRALPPLPGAAAGAGSSSAWMAEHQLNFEGCQEARREIAALIASQDPVCRYGDLQKVVALSGDVLWLCKEHAKPHAHLFSL